MLQKLESGLLYLMRVLMVLLVLFTLFSLALWAADSLRSPAASATQATTDWSGFKIDDAELKRTTYSDFGFADSDHHANDDKLAKDGEVVAAFTQVDQLLRAAILQNPDKRRQVDAAGDDAGLTDAQSLADWLKASREKASAGTAVSAAVDATAGVQGDDEEFKPQPVNITEALLNQTHGIIDANGYDAGRAFVLGAPAAFKTLLADAQVQRGMAQQTTSFLVSNLLLNYNMAFSTKVSGTDADTAGTRPSWLERLMEPSNLLVFTVLMWTLVFMMLIVVFLRVERHLRAMASEGRVLASAREASPMQ
ncbi:hypothetical protein H9K76_18655 [Diaphorobacter ruginosibacter]|uniref:Uncharacterized protein n=1 Tax=Diaphorobacter ruginosibacter TaxID=1715720 RepID=A0A7G9RLQ7_9BURK|nr:hypothetical protein [Diaphorobacter ruginosibacter]QNN56532.1 hypothetical protein H9K76_18655 [Diaphorobacter ruginosibacter]